MECFSFSNSVSSYGSRRGNDRIMARGTFANIRLVNKFMKKAGPKTVHFPSNDELSVFDAAMRYKQENVTAIILAGKEIVLPIIFQKFLENHLENFKENYFNNNFLKYFFKIVF